MGSLSFEELWPSLALQGPNAGQLKARDLTMSMEFVLAHIFRDHIFLESASSGRPSPHCVDGHSQQWSAAIGFGENLNRKKSVIL